MHLPLCPLDTSLHYLCVGNVEGRAHCLIILKQSTLGKRNVATLFHQPHSRVAVTNWRRATINFSYTFEKHFPVLPACFPTKKICITIN